MLTHCPGCGSPVVPSLLSVALLDPLGRYLRAVGPHAVTAHGLVARLYPAPAEPDGWEGLRSAIEVYVPLAGAAAPNPVRLAMVFRGLRGVTLRADGLRLVLDGRTAGRARWTVERWEGTVGS